MLFKQDIVRGIAAGEVTLAFRRWRKPAAVAGGKQHTFAGMIGFDRVDPVDPAAITESDARAAGFDSRDALMRSLEGREGDIYRIAVRYLGADPRIALREQADLDPAERASLAARLEKMGAWTREVLRLIRDHEGVRAADLAVRLGRETLDFKRDVRKLKALGLTESLEVGYRLSPRGRAVLDGEG
ncbi:hypothetical protein RCO27_01265 [Sphingosinicella sp. LHD-64]|uniref:hypothetical protein n=1 Tax=Sphingosinicella sp. LHD-64 TaxID=3072139 RepID=UPI0028105A7E|nr:hypothetical protein [Sphingosinicella sp. LHD-64]MDQ8754845.1 hypothetical protein [Sphingosinicella sp. LHD-64]